MKFNICDLCNYFMDLIAYSFGFDEEHNYIEIRLDVAVLVIIISFTWLIIIAWWLVPLRFICNKYLKDITFKSSKKE